MSASSRFFRGSGDDDAAFMKRGRCTDPDENPDDWFPAHGKVRTKTPAIRHAIELCENACPVKDECLAYAVEHDGPGEQHLTGIWGGTTESQRRTTKRGAA